MWWRKEHKKNQVKKESQQGRDQWWIWSREAMKWLHQRYLLLHQKALGKPDTKVSILWARKLRSTLERWDPLYTHTHQATQNEMLMKLGLLKSGNLMNWWMIERWDPQTERPVVCSQRAHQFVIEDDETESELSLESRSFLHRVNDQVRKRQNQSSKDALEDSEEHSVIWWMFLSSTLQASVFMGKNYSDNWHSIKNTDLTMKQMFDISEKLVSEQSNEIYGVKTMGKLFMEVFVFDWWWTSHQSSAHKVYVFSDAVLCLGKMNENPQSNCAWEDRLTWFKSSSEYRTLDRIDGEAMEFDWNIFPGFTTLQVSHKIKELLLRLSVTPEKFTGRIIFMSMFNDISWGSRDNKKECESNAQLVSLYAKRFGAGQWSFLGPGSEKKWYSIREDSHKVNGTELQRRWCWHSQKADIQSSEPRVHSPEECLKAKVVENCRYTIVPTRKRFKLFFSQLLL